MTTPSRVPPSRAARLHLRHRLAVALRGADLLEQKLRILFARHERLDQAEESSGSRWHDLVEEADTWLLRAVLLSGEYALDGAAAGVGPARITIDETVTMGVRYPSEVTCALQDRAPDSAAPANTALVHAEAAYREAVRAAAEYAVAHAAARIVGAEVLSTRRRVRALRRHWIPRLETALARVELALEQSEHEDAVRRRWAARTLRESTRGAGK
ncbi:vacuolar-type H+-ATPase subunit D/Vma8 [Streptomyces sp. B4I13]|uniref:V-type ATP synthase subunit D n=1 Tax=Streptomyces sp. B4I13 TaxID=3042271 RepID=UPI0027813516|nr:V-type ATP synthase subunit D [Streptomyces sp. B4I13]MDQ0957164.1 vacuolar-type H+-ATPase subunit D/Vma8 [Streptomyces sp. B4I13]